MWKHLLVNNFINSSNAKKNALVFIFFFVFLSFAFCTENLRIDKRGRFRILRSGSAFDAKSAGDVAYVVRSKNNISSIVLADETGYKQCFYDAEMNIVKEQKWNYTSDSPILAVETLYTYAETETLTHKKQRTITRFDEKTQIKTRYNPCGTVAAESVFELNEINQPKKKPISSFMKKYDEKGRVIEEQTASLEHGHIKRIFSYDGKGLRPDEKRYESNKEVFVKTYINEKDYQEKVIFDDGTTVVTSYENGVKKAQYIERNGKIIRSISE
jgi:hypothetical protein